MTTRGWQPEKKSLFLECAVTACGANWTKRRAVTDYTAVLRWLRKISRGPDTDYRASITTIGVRTNYIVRKRRGYVMQVGNKSLYWLDERAG